MMKSIEELRRAADEIADRAVPCGASPDYSDVRWRIGQLADAIEKELAERYVELPEDGSGEVWHNGDMAQSKRFPYLRAKKVCGTGVINGQSVLFYVADNGGHCPEEHKGWDYASSMLHYNPDTFEDIINEAVAVGMDGGCADTSILVARCKALAN